MTGIDGEARRMAAAKLRAEAAALERDEELSDGQLIDAVYNACMDGVAFDRYTGEPCEFDREFLLRMADLIEPNPRPTTRRICSNPGAIHEKYPCDVCGMSIGDRRWRHCPGCGAEVMRRA